ncbi:MAG TPA: hypothetical protein VF173_33025 [Thermoanaerobaculia bacterium]|nr:hypothetical protein [Thermoanaerobaculia bacterium]
MKTDENLKDDNGDEVIPNPEAIAEDRLVFYGLLAIAVMAVVQLTSVNPLDAALRFSVASFSVVIPLLVGSLVALNLEAAQERVASPTRFSDVSQFLAICGGLFGVLGIFWHFSWYIGILFFIGCIWAMVVVLQMRRRLRNLNYAAAAEPEREPGTS